MEEHPSFDKAPFVRKHLDTTTDMVSIRLNQSERAELQALKDQLRIDADSTAFKASLNIARNVLQAIFGNELLPFLCSPRRVRPGRK